MVTEVIKKEGQKMISGNEIMFLRKMAGYKSQAALADAIGVSRSAATTVCSL